MSVTVQIGNDQRALADVTERWLQDELGRRGRHSESSCVVVTINTSGVNLRLGTPACGGGGGSRPPNPREAEIVGLWTRHKLNAEGFTLGDLTAFLTQLRKYF
jgi:hypothetical protein